MKSMQNYTIWYHFEFSSTLLKNISAVDIKTLLVNQLYNSIDKLISDIIIHYLEIKENSW